MSQPSLYTIRKKIGDQLAKIFYEFTSQFKTSIEINVEMRKILPYIISKFEKDLAGLEHLDTEYMILIFKNCIDNFKGYTDISDPYTNEYTTARYMKLPAADKDFYLESREIATSIMHSYLTNLMRSDNLVANSGLRFKGLPGHFIELLTALYENGNIERLDKKKLTRAELQSKFRQFFNMDDFPGFNDQNLSKRLSERKSVKERSLFLEDLKKAFLNYSEEKNR